MVHTYAVYVYKKNKHYSGRRERRNGNVTFTPRSLNFARRNLRIFARRAWIWWTAPALDLSDALELTIPTGFGLEAALELTEDLPGALELTIPTGFGLKATLA